MIEVLEKNVSDKIAAGEVIENPVSIIKELVENSIDAGASSVTCEIKNGGKSYIRVTDNGSGIERSEAELAFLRHATSKIKRAEDLASISTLGFRGEALASIAAVTRTTLITKTADSEIGTKLTIDGGEIISNEATGCPDGTTFIVTDLFYNTPARREFLSNDARESSLVTQFMSEIAIGFTDIRFQLIINDRTVFTTKGDGDLKRALISVYKIKEYEDLIHIDQNYGDTAVEAMISRPSLSRTSRKDQVFLVNGRVVKSKVLEGAVRDGYKERLFEGRYPVVFIKIGIPSSEIDVNIHPNKREIRFHDDKKMHDILTGAIVEALASNDAVIKVGDYYHQDQKEEKTDQINVKQILSNRRETFIPDTDDQRHEGADISTVSGHSNAQDDETLAVSDSAVEIEASDFDLDPGRKPFDFNDLKITGCIFDTYITLENEGSFYLIDQHAAHERIFYEKLVREYLADEKPSQLLLTPVSIDVSPEDAEISELWLPHLRAMGYDISEFGPATYIIKEIPLNMELSEAEGFAKDFVSSSSELASTSNKVVIDKLITRSCKSAVKAHDKLSREEMEVLLADLTKCRNPFSCPHGRPTAIRFTRYEIEKFFKRIQ